MSTAAVVRRELSARRQLWVVAGAAAAIAGLAPFLPGAGGYGRADVWMVASSSLAVAIGWSLAIGLGATLFGSDLAAGRLGYFFSRPLSGWSLWWGRTLAAAILVLGCELVVLAPALLGGDGVLLEREVAVMGALALIPAPMILLLAAHAAGIMVRARTGLLVLDLAAVVVAAVAVWMIVTPFLLMAAVQAMFVVAALLVAAALAALACGGAVGLMSGRTDLRRTHRALSLALWTTSGALLAGIGLFGAWLRGFEPSDFDRVEVVSTAPDGSWVELYGGTHSRLDVRRRCLFATAGDRWLSVPGGSRFDDDQVVFSADGSSVVWRGGDLGDRPRPLWWADLSKQEPSARPTSIAVGPDAVFVLDDDGRRTAVLDNGTLTIYTLADQRSVRAVRLPQSLQRAALFFTSGDRMHLIARDDVSGVSALRIAEIDLVSGRVAATSSIDGLTGRSWIVVDPGVEHLIVSTEFEADSSWRQSLHRVSTGALVRRLADPRVTRFLSDGRLVALSIDDDRRATLVVEDASGERRIEHPLGDAWDLLIGGEPLPGWVALSRLVDPADRSQGRRFELLQIDSGERRVIGTPVRRTLPWFPWRAAGAGVDLWYRGGPGSSRLAIDQGGALVRWDPGSDELVPVVYVD